MICHINIILILILIMTTLIIVIVATSECVVYDQQQQEEHGEKRSIDMEVSRVGAVTSTFQLETATLCHSHRHRQPYGQVRLVMDEVPMENNDDDFDDDDDDASRRRSSMRTVVTTLEVALQTSFVNRIFGTAYE